MRTLGLRARVLAGLALVVVVLAVVAVAIIDTTRDELVGQIDDQLVAASSEQRASGFERHDDDHDRPPPDDAAPAPPERLSAMFEGIVAADGSLEVFFESNLPGQDFGLPDLDPADLADRSEPFTTGSVEGDVRYRVLASPIGDEGLGRALPLDDVDDTLARLVRFEGIGLAVVVAVVAAVAWWVIHLGVRPIRSMTDAAGGIAAGDLSRRVPEPRSSGTEAADLARALNAMLDRIQAAVDDQARSEERLRRFVADASHELRTPLTTLRGYAELYEAGGLDDPGELDDAMRRTRQESERMGRLVEDMLTLARLDREPDDARAVVDLSRVVRDAVADARATQPGRPVTDEIGDHLTVAGSEDRLRQVLANVVGNALVHTPATTAVHVAAHRDGDATVVEVRDEGPGMTAEVAARVTERFFRADPGRSRARGGSGLGLAIADAVVGGHGGTLTVDSDPATGTVVRLVFPGPDPGFSADSQPAPGAR